MTTASPEDPVEDFLPLRPVEFLVIAVLNERELHGYGIVQEIEERTDGKVSIAPGNLYRVLDRLLQRGLLAWPRRLRERHRTRPAGTVSRRLRTGCRHEPTGRARLSAESADGKLHLAAALA